MSSLGDDVTGIIGNGFAASQNPNIGWIGSLNSISNTGGYWVIMNQPGTLSFQSPNLPGGNSPDYILNIGANLISFPINGSHLISDVLPDDIEPYITQIVGEGAAAQQNPTLGWVGSLSSLEGSKGYWFQVSEPIQFQFIFPENRQNSKTNRKTK